MEKAKRYSILVILIICMNLCAFGMVWHYNRLSTYRQEFQAAKNTIHRIWEENKGKLIIGVPYISGDKVHYHTIGRNSIDDKDGKRSVHDYLNMLHLSEKNWLVEYYIKPTDGFASCAFLLVLFLVLTILEAIIIMGKNRGMSCSRWGIGWPVFCSVILAIILLKTNLSLRDRIGPLDEFDFGLLVLLLAISSPAYIYMIQYLFRILGRKIEKDKILSRLLAAGFSILAIFMFVFVAFISEAEKAEFRDYYWIKEEDERRKALKEQTTEQVTEVTAEEEYTTCAYCNIKIPVSRVYCNRHTCKEEGCSNGVRQAYDTCAECILKNYEKNKNRKEKESTSTQSTGSKNKKETNKKKESNKKKTTYMPDCDDYEDYEDFMDEWDGYMPDGSDAEDYWEDW